MAKKTTAKLAIRQWTAPELELAIKQIQRRRDAIQALIEKAVRHNDPEIEAVVEQVKTTIREVYGVESPEYEEHRYFRIDNGPWRMGMSSNEMQFNIDRGLPRAVTIVDGLLMSLQERLQDLNGNPDAKVHEAFRGMALHPRIAKKIAALFDNGHYENAVFDACKVLVDMVKERSHRFDLDGVQLMLTVFSANKPVLRFNELNDQVEKDEQQGMMHLYAGAMLALRNPRGHGFPKDSSERALQYLAFLSLLAARLDDTELVESPEK